MLTIGELARDVGLNPPTIRYYEEIGLIPEAPRSESGYRLYSEEDARRLKFIQRAKMLSLSLEEIKEMVLSAVDGDLSKAAECFRTGWNRVNRISAAGLDEYQKAAKGIIKLNLPMAKGLTIDELADKLRAMNS